MLPCLQAAPTFGPHPGILFGGIGAPQVMGRRLDDRASPTGQHPGLGSPGSPHTHPSQISRENRDLAPEPSLRARSCSAASHVRLVFGCCWHLCQALMASRSLPSHPQITLSWLFLVQRILLPLASADALSPPDHFPAGLSPLPYPRAGRSEIAEESAFPLRKALHTQPHTVMGRPGPSGL